MRHTLIDIQNIKFTPSVKSLGVEIDNKLYFDLYISMLF